ncbi:MAG: dihydroorotate dehydrogenase-like protein [Gemmatimonadaceae bacterium]|nr:dihydroorotate dehydrogenase-like protein [Gemmatimonadaceae bacterium]
MPDLRTTWMGLSLPTPVVLGASPLAHDVEAVAAAVAAGAGAVVMYSLFEEQVVNEQMAAHHFIDARMDADAEAAGFLPDVDVFSLGAEPYLAQLQRLKERVAVPVIASLNGVTPGGWTEYARACEVRGADALELNLYDVVTSAEENAHRVEERQLEVVHAVVHAVDIPVTVKIGPAYTSVPAFVRRLKAAGAAGVTLFNRFYQPDVDLETLGVDRRLKLSTPAELPQRLHALAVLSPTAAVALACTGGVHSGHDAAKALLCGAHVVQVTSAVLQHGPGQLRPIVDGLRAWLAETGYVSSDEARGVLAMGSTRDASVWERLNYVRMLDGWRMERVPRG